MRHGLIVQYAVALGSQHRTRFGLYPLSGRRSIATAHSMTALLRWRRGCGRGLVPDRSQNPAHVDPGHYGNCQSCRCGAGRSLSLLVSARAFMLRLDSQYGRS